jgi:subtilisin family serine protease
MSFPSGRSTKVVSLYLCYLLVILLCSPFSTAAKSASRSTPVLMQEQPPAAYRKGELLVRFRSGVSRQARDTIIATYRAKRKKQLAGESNLEAFELQEDVDPRSAALQLTLNPQVELAEPNFVISKDDLIPNDNRFHEQWALRNTGQNGGQYGADVNATGGWATTTGSKATVIAVIDSGIDFTHPDLTANQWSNPAPGANNDQHGWDYVANSPDIKDEQGHGTAVAGIIAAEGNNSAGSAGVMWRASLMSLRVLDNTGTGDIASAVEAIDYAIAHGAQVINLSWGTTGNSIALKEAIERALKRDIAVVCSAGNASKNLQLIPYYPASFDTKNLIAVAATDQHDELTSLVQLGRSKCHRCGTGNRDSHHADGWWLSECNRHLSRSTAGRGNRWLDEDIQTRRKCRASFSGYLQRSAPNGGAFRKGIEWRRGQRGGGL